MNTRGVGGPALIVVVVVGTVLGACGVVPVTQTPGPPPVWTFVDPHGRPRAFGGGVCPLQGRHTHGWPPSPQRAFVDDNGAWRETRRLVSYAGAHSVGDRRCAVPTLHQHAIDDVSMLDRDATDVSAGSASATP